MKLTTPQIKPTPLSGAARWRRGGITVGVAALGLSLAALAAPANAATHPAASKSATVEVEVKTVANYGKILVDQKGLPLYYDTKNTPGHWACTKGLSYRLATTGAFQGPEVSRGRPGCEGFGHGQGSLRDTGHLERQGPVHLH